MTTTTRKRKYVNTDMRLMMEAMDCVRRALDLVGPANVRGLIREWLAIEEGERKAILKKRRSQGPCSPEGK